MMSSKFTILSNCNRRTGTCKGTCGKKISIPITFLKTKVLKHWSIVSNLAVIKLNIQLKKLYQNFNRSIPMQIKPSIKSFIQMAAYPTVAQNRKQCNLQKKTK